MFLIVEVQVAGTGLAKTGKMPNPLSARVGGLAKAEDPQRKNDEKKHGPEAKGPWSMEQWLGPPPPGDCENKPNNDPHDHRQYFVV